MPSYNNTLEEIKSRLDIVDIISECVPLKKTGQNWKGLCPFHAEKTPSFIVSQSKQIYRCFGCGTGGDIFSFMVKYENISFQESLNILAKKAGVTLIKSRKQAAAAGEKENLLKLHRYACNFYQLKLKQNPGALKYLKNRGVSVEAQEIFSIGYAPKGWDELFSHLKTKKYKDELIKKSGLITRGTKNYYDTFRDRIIFPIIDLRGEVIAFGGRVMGDSMPKYLNSPETPVFNKGRILYGLNSAKESFKKSEFAVFVEGYFDVITASIYGFPYTVAPLGTALTKEHSSLIKRFTQEVVVVFDSDVSGIKAAQKAIGILLEGGLNVTVLPLPDGEDPDSLLRKKGRDAFADLLEKRVSFIDFFMMQAGTGPNFKRDRLSLCNEAVEIIARIPNSIERGDYVKLLSERAGFNERDIREQLMKIMTKPQPKRVRNLHNTAGTENKTISRPKDEVYLLQLIMQFPEKARQVFGHISPEDIKDPVIRLILEKIKHKIDLSGDAVISYGDLVSECEGDAENLLSELAFKTDFEEPEKIFSDCLNRIKFKKRQILLYDIQDKIKRAENEKNGILLKTLLMEKQKLLKSNG